MTFHPKIKVLIGDTYFEVMTALVWLGSSLSVLQVSTTYQASMIHVPEENYEHCGISTSC
jgi:hypothetical protein